MAWFERDLKDHLIQTPFCGQGCHLLNQTAQGGIQLGLECLQGWGTHNFSGQLDLTISLNVLSLHSLIKNFFSTLRFSTLLEGHYVVSQRPYYINANFSFYSRSIKQIGFYGVNASSATNVDTVSVFYHSRLLWQMCPLPGFVFNHITSMMNNSTFSTGKDQ